MNNQPENEEQQQSLLWIDFIPLAALVLGFLLFVIGVYVIEPKAALPVAGVLLMVFGIKGAQ